MRLRTVTCRMVWLLAMALLAGPAAAQDYTGRIEVSLTDTTGAVLPGVAVEVSGPQRASSIRTARVTRSS